MATIMSALPIWAFDRNDPEMRQALAAGWRRVDLWWERRQEQAHRALAEGKFRRAKRSFRMAYGLARFVLPTDDPRQATSIANLAALARLDGADARAERLYACARRLWANTPKHLEKIHIQPRARSSLFHLRMEVKHWDTYQSNMKARLGKFIQESDEALQALSESSSSPHRLVSRWRGEKPAVFDDTRKLLAACLLIAGVSTRGASDRN